jgi:hypothetical protein
LARDGCGDGTHRGMVWYGSHGWVCLGAMESLWYVMDGQCVDVLGPVRYEEAVEEFNG